MFELMVIVIAVLLLWGVFLFNRLVKDRNRVRSAWSDIDVQLTRRHELIPQLVTSVEAYMKHERATLEAVVEMRSRSVSLDEMADKAGVEEQLEAGVHKLIALAESYPDLKANENFIELQNELVDVEDHLQYARRFYNGAVKILNTRVETIPDVIVANTFGFKPAVFFQAGSREAPKVQF